MITPPIPPRRSRRAFLARMALLPVVAAAVASVAPAEAFEEPATVPPDTAADKPRRRALLIGIHAYQKRGASGEEIPGPWADLNTPGDVWAIKRVLMDRFGFQNDEIKVLLTPGETTRQSVLAALRDVLVAPARPGDTIFFHYSGHGGEQYTASGLHQTLVPSDWREEEDEQGRPQTTNHIFDTEIAALLTQLKRNLRAGQADAPPSSVTLVFDCCHSGFLTAGVRGARGGANTPRLRGRDKAFPLKRPVGIRTPPPARLRGSQSSGDGEGLLGADDLAPRGFVALLACRHDQSAGEIEAVPTEADASPEALGGGAGAKRPMGRLSFFLAQALDQAGKQTTYRDIFEQVRGNMAARYPDQDPVIEGDQNNLLLKGRAAPSPRYLEVIVAAPVNTAPPGAPPAVFLRAGQIQGVTARSEFALYPAGTSDFKAAKPVARAIVTSAELTQATLAIQPAEVGRPAPSPRTLIGARALVTRQGVAENPLRVNLAALAARSDQNALRAALAPVSGPDGLLEIVVGDDPGQVQAVPADRLPPGAVAPGTPVAGVIALVTQPDQGVAALLSCPDAGATSGGVLRDGLLRLARARVLRELKINERPIAAGGGKAAQTASDGVQVEIRLVPVAVEPRDASQPLSRRNVRVAQASARALAQAEAGDKAAPAGANKAEWSVGEWFAIQARNTGKNDAFLTLLDIPADGSVTALWPLPAQRSNPRAGFLPVGDGSWVTLTEANRPWAVEITEPAGGEQIKGIATREALNVASLVDYSPEGVTRGEIGMRGVKSPLARLFRATQKGMRAAGSEAPGIEDVGTSTVTFRVTRG